MATMVLMEIGDDSSGGGFNDIIGYFFLMTFQYTV